MGQFPLDRAFDLPDPKRFSSCQFADFPDLLFGNAPEDDVAWVTRLRQIGARMREAVREAGFLAGRRWRHDEPGQTRVQTTRDEVA
jgi:hypothetical protein